MDRRKFIKSAGAGAAASAAIAAPAVAQSMPKVSWRLTSSYPKSLDTLFGISTQVAKRVAEATDGQFQIQTFAAGEIVPALQALDAVQNGTVECSHTLASFYIGKDTAFAFETSLPFGMNTRQQNAWLYAGGGLELCRDFMKKFNIHTIPSGNTGAQMGGWFRKEIKSVADLQGLKFRIAGLGGRIMSKLGVVPQTLGGGDIYPALERGTLDAAEFSGPYDDEKLGFQKVAKYYYYPGFWEGCANVSFIANMEKWNALPAHYRAIVEAACAEANALCMAKYDHGNPDALIRLVGTGAELRPFPQDVMQAAFKEAFALYAELAASNPNFKTFWDSFLPYWKKEQLWFRVAELPFDAFNAQAAAQLR
ncbi:ABC transporter substrate-binding protein [Bosea sp. (in: a-proteobacteria)]|jgi:TRAP-type mannitol/chloroaromatic compound transport system substrate-binding protein|uniref:TRAP transporter substrate-binding protein n=1 Tax=Bosea sp. (in: a-proteobacteria) TaxID=1871050 RepID=UPI001ACAD5E7|nr:ABC transporter substrate-binding protein [Bosea sp. (in: a-proteobacteria)]MBN9438578.1 ABC transporter substrate-binding protein [Bosea sp. (in: a-proteobacteria)]